MMRVTCLLRARAPHTAPMPRLAPRVPACGANCASDLRVRAVINSRARVVWNGAGGVRSACSEWCGADRGRTLRNAMTIRSAFVCALVAAVAALALAAGDKDGAMAHDHSADAAGGANHSGGLTAADAEGVTVAHIGGSHEDMKTIGKTIGSGELDSDSADFDILAKLVGAAGLAETLSAPGGRFTVFAPTDAAFTALSREAGSNATAEQDVFDALAATLGAINADDGGLGPILNTVLKYHLLGDAYPLERLPAMADTLAGEKISVDGTTVFDLDPSRRNATLVGGLTNIMTVNGWIHAVDSVLLPLDFKKAVAEVAARPAAEGTATDASPEADTDAPGAIGGAVPATTTGAVADDDEGSDVTSSPDSDEDEEDDDAVCFPSSATVRLADGTHMPMHMLAAGHAVHASESGATSPVFLFTHKVADHKLRTFVKVTTASGHSITLTPSHYLYANSRLTTAAAVKIGDKLRTVAGPSAVTDVTTTRTTGLYAPHTVHGDLVVDGIVASGYSSALHPTLAHALLAPVRAFVKATATVEPLGSVFYNGADTIVRFLPKGAHVY